MCDKINCAPAKLVILC